MEQEFVLDKWQKRVLDTKGNITIRAGRQVGKSTIIALKAAHFARHYHGTVTLIIAAAQRQSSLLFEKILAELEIVNKAMLEEAGEYKEDPKISSAANYYKKRAYEAKHGLFKEQPTRTEVKLNNGSRIYSLPAGRSGWFIRGFTLDLLIADEAAYIPEIVWTSVRPMIAVSRKRRKLGWIILISTPFGKGGYFYDSFYDDEFTQFHINSEHCPRIPKDFLRREKIRLTKLEYAQEYLGEFVDEFRQFFPTALIKQCMTFITWPFEQNYTKNKKYYLGVDIARYGADENAFVITEQDPAHKNRWKIVHCETTERKSLTDTVGRILRLNATWQFKKILTDDTGVGGGVTDMLKEKLGTRIIGINNSTRAVDEDRNKRILKEDLYSNAAVMMEKGEIEIISNLKLLKSLKCMTFEYTGEGNVKIKGKYSHLSEAFVRACWAKKTKHLNIFLA